MKKTLLLMSFGFLFGCGGGVGGGTPSEPIVGYYVGTPELAVLSSTEDQMCTTYNSSFNVRGSDNGQRWRPAVYYFSGTEFHVCDELEDGFECALVGKVVGRKIRISLLDLLSDDDDTKNAPDLADAWLEIFLKENSDSSIAFETFQMVYKQRIIPRHQAEGFDEEFDIAFGGSWQKIEEEDARELYARSRACTAPETFISDKEDLESFLKSKQEFISTELTCSENAIVPTSSSGNKMVFQDDKMLLTINSSTCHHVIEMDYQAIDNVTLQLSNARSVEGDCPEYSDVSPHYVRQFRIEHNPPFVAWTHLTGTNECRILYYN